MKSAELNLAPFKSHKIVHGSPMTHDQYVKFYGENKDHLNMAVPPEVNNIIRNVKLGFLVAYNWQTEREYFSWSPLQEFQEGYKPATESAVSPEDQAQILSSFVNQMIGAYESGFVEESKLTLYEVYRVMQNHCVDELNVKVPNIETVWGKDSAIDCGAKHLEKDGSEK